MAFRRKEATCGTVRIGQRVPLMSGYLPTPHQLAVHKSKATFICHWGGFRSSKTFGACKWAMERAAMAGGQRVLIGRKHYSTLMSTTLMTFWDAVAPVRDWFILDHNQQRREITVRANDGGTSTIIYSQLDDENKLRGLEVGAVYVDEAHELSLNSYVTLLARRSHPAAVNRQVLLTTNPTNKDHWLYSRFFTHGNEDYQLIQSTTYDNPFLSPDVIRDMENNYPESWRRKFMLGEPGVCMGMAVYGSQFVPSLHVVDTEPEKDSEFILGWDFGVHRPSCVVLEVRRSGQVVIWDGLLGLDESITTFEAKVARRLQELFGGLDGWRLGREWGDLAGGARDSRSDGCTDISLLRGLGHNVIACPRHEQRDGITSVRHMLESMDAGKPRLVVASRASHLMAEMLGGGYYYPDGSDGEPMRYADGDLKPKKDGFYDHIADAMRYALVGLFGLRGGRKADVERLLSGLSEINARRMLS